MPGRLRGGRLWQEVRGGGAFGAHDVKWRRSKVATSVSLRRSATARRGERGACRRAGGERRCGCGGREAACSSVVAAWDAVPVLPGIGGNDHGWIRSQ